MKKILAFIYGTLPYVLRLFKSIHLIGLRVKEKYIAHIRNKRRRS